MAIFLHLRFVKLNFWFCQLYIETLISNRLSTRHSDLPGEKGYNDSKYRMM
nr:MAG TPA: hypothetical protein [Caudoviricetes sp.]DAV65966.1 MAG TPA: hypothetical protein [Caudoviricetes sp.]